MGEDTTAQGEDTAIVAASDSAEKPNGTSINPLDIARALEPEHIEAISLLMTGMSVTATARTIGRNPETVFTWLKANDNFRTYYELCKAAKAETLLLKAQSTLETRMDSDDEKISVSAADSAARYAVGMAKANQQVTHTVVLDKLRDVIKAIPADTVDAEYKVLSDGS